MLENKEYIVQSDLIQMIGAVSEEETETMREDWKGYLPYETEEEEEPVIVEEESQEQNVYFQMYLDDLAQIDEMSEDEMQEAYKKLLDGDGSVVGEICESWLGSIAQMAIPYAEQGART